MWIAFFVGTIAFLIWRSIRSPSVAICGALCLFSLEQLGQAKIPFLAQHGAFTNFTIGALLLLALGLQIIRGRITVHDYPRLGYLMLLLLLYAYASSLWAPRPDLSAAQWSTGWPYLASFVLLAPLLLENTKGANLMLSTFVIVGTCVTILLLLFVKWESRYVVIETGKIVSFGNPLVTAQMAGNVALVAVLCRHLRPVEPWVVVRWLVLAASLGLAVKSGSRGQILSLLVVLTIFWPMATARRDLMRYAGVAAGCLVLGAALYMGVQWYWGAGDVRWSESKMVSDLDGRWEMAAKLLSAWWGEGPATIFGGLGNSAAFDPRIVGFYPHILPLEILAEEGVLGLGIFIAILLMAVKEFRSARRLTNDSPQEREILVVLAAMVAYAFLLSFKQGSLIGHVDMWMVVIMLGKYASQIKYAHRR